MAITYPRALPAELRIQRSNFYPVYGTSGPEYTRGGGVQNIEHSDPYWVCEIESSEVRASDAVALRTWLDTLRGGMKTFLAHDQARPRPAAYANDSAVTSLTRATVGGAFNGTFELTTITAYALRTASASLTLPNGFQLRVGDYISVVQNNRYSLHRVTEDVQATAGGQMNASNREIAIEPWIKTSLFTAGATANILRPLGEFFLDPESVQVDPNPRLTSISFKGKSKVQI